MLLRSVIPPFGSVASQHQFTYISFFCSLLTQVQTTSSFKGFSPQLMVFLDAGDGRGEKLVYTSLPKGVHRFRYGDGPVVFPVHRVVNGDVTFRMYSATSSGGRERLVNIPLHTALFQPDAPGRWAAVGTVPRAALGITDGDTRFDQMFHVDVCFQSLPKEAPALGSNVSQAQPLFASEQVYLRCVQPSCGALCALEQTTTDGDSTPLTSCTKCGTRSLDTPLLAALTGVTSMEEVAAKPHNRRVHAAPSGFTGHPFELPTRLDSAVPDAIEAARQHQREAAQAQVCAATAAMLSQLRSVDDVYSCADIAFLFRACVVARRFYTDGHAVRHVHPHSTEYHTAPSALCCCPWRVHGRPCLAVVAAR